MSIRSAFAISLLLLSPVQGDELILKSGKKIEWVAMRDAGDSLEVELPQGTKITVAKADVDKILLTPAVKPEPKPSNPAPIPKSDLAPGKLLEIPAPAAFADAKKRVEKDYEDDYKAAKGNRAAKKSLASKMLTSAASAEAVDRFVLLLEAMGLAADGLEPTVAMSAMSELAKSYPVKVEELRTKVFERVRSAKKPGDSEREIAESYFLLARKALAADDYDSAIALARESYHPKVLSSSALFAGLVSSVQQFVAEVTDAQKEWEKVKAADIKLAATPEDPASNLERGRFLCFFKGDWTAGLLCLAKAGDRYGAVATAEQGRPSDPAAQLEAADLWLGIALKEKEPYKRKAAERTVYWYSEAWDTLTPPQLAKIEKSLAQAQEMTGRVNLLLVKTTMKRGGWNTSGKSISPPGQGSGDVLEFAYAPPPQFDLELFVDNPDCHFGIGATNPNMKLFVVLDGSNVSTIGMTADKAASAPKSQPKIFQSTKQSSILIQVRLSSVTVSVDGATILDWKGNLKDLAQPVDWKIGMNTLFFSHGQNASGAGHYRVLGFTLVKK